MSESPSDTNEVHKIPSSMDSPGGRRETRAGELPQRGYFTPANSTTDDLGGAIDDRGGSMPFVYAIGHVEARFPSSAVEREYSQVAGQFDTRGQTDNQAMHQILSERQNRYLARQMCWLFSVERLPTFVLMPRDPLDLELLIESIRSDPDGYDVDVVVGLRGPLAPPDACGGLVLPIVAFDQLYSFKREELLSAIPLPSGTAAKDEKAFRTSAGELFDRFIQVADNAGSMDEHRALNYLAVRYPAVYHAAVEAHREEKSLTGVEVRPSRLSVTENILDVIFSYTHRRTDVTEKYFVRVNVSGEFPFLISKLQPYYER